MSPVTLVTVDGKERELLECSVWGLQDNRGHNITIKVMPGEGHTTISHHIDQGHITMSHNKQGHIITINATPWCRMIIMPCHDKVMLKQSTPWQSQSTTIKVTQEQSSSMTVGSRFDAHGTPGQETVSAWKANLISSASEWLALFCRRQTQFTRLTG